MTSPQDFKSLQEKVQSALVATVKSANRVSAEDLPFQRAVNPGVADDLDAKTARLLELTTTLLKSAANVCGINAPELEDTDDIELRRQGIADVVDSVLEKADTSIDEYTGALKRKDAPTADTAPQPKKPKTGTDRVIRNANISKPQLAFDPPVENNAPWRPVITKKPHAKVPLEESFKHPYETEILDAKYPDRVYEQAEPIPWQPVEKTEAIYIDTYEGVLEMLEDLKKAKEIAVDLEHHDYRTYVGLTSLMQISTREKDWIVDTLKPWRQQLQVLNEVFADPSIVKIFHGAYMDIIWLQRDLGLYVNGLFDTYFACEALNYSQRSLAFLLSKFANFAADKRYQIADWRMRPLPEEMLYYARSDTHYLLYIYDKIRNELVMKSDRGNPETDYIETVLQKSKALSLSRYEGEHFDPDTGKGSKGWYNVLLKHPSPFSGQQFAVYRTIWAWRDEVARREDESTAYVLPNAIVGDIAKHMPPDAKALHALIPNNAFIARRNVNNIWARYQEARERGINEPTLMQFFRSDLPTAGGKAVAKAPEDEEAALQPAPLERSQLFGDMPLSSRWEETPFAAKGLGEYVMLPWTKYVQNVATVEAGQEDVAMEGGVEEAKAAAALTQPAEPEVEEEFTLKAGTKRKAPTNDASDGSDDESDSGSSSVNIVLDSPVTKSKKSKRKSMDDSERKARTNERRVAKIARYTEEYEKAQAEVERLTEEVAQERAYPVQLVEAEDIAKEKKEKLDRYATAVNKRKSKAEKKALKQAKKLEKEAKKAEKEAKKAKKGAAGSEEAAFDYTQATSVLHANRNGGSKGASKPAFDPYAKTGDDGPKGARKAPPTRGERSATFKK